jgi:hypothetical protein
MRSLFASLLAALVFVGCATTENQSSDPKPKAKAGEKPYKDKPEPKLGMSKDEIQQIWGKPKRVNGTPNGETWQYDDTELALIPFNFGFKPRFYIFTFDKEGKLVDYSISKHD